MISRRSGQLVSEGARRWLPRSGNGTCGTREQADVPHFVFSTDPCGKASWSSGLQFATTGKSSGQMSVAVGTRDIWGCDSWRKRDRRRTSNQVSSRAARTDRQRQEDQEPACDGAASRQAAMGAPARWAKARLRRARRKYKGCVRDARIWEEKKWSGGRSGQDWRESWFFPCA